MRVDNNAAQIGVAAWHPSILRLRPEARAGQVKPLAISGPVVARPIA